MKVQLTDTAIDNEDDMIITRLTISYIQAILSPFTEDEIPLIGISSNALTLWLPLLATVGNCDGQERDLVICTMRKIINELEEHNEFTVDLKHEKSKISKSVNEDKTMS